MQYAPRQAVAAPESSKTECLPGGQLTHKNNRVHLTRLPAETLAAAATWIGAGIHKYV